MNQKDNYFRIAEAIDYLKQNFKGQPGLDELAEKMNLSPAHFQKLFSDWAGVSPKKFLQYISVEYAKSILKEQPSTLFDVANETGLSGTGRLHDLFVTIEGMTPGEYKNGGLGLSINFSFAETVFGNIIIASTSKGICYTAFFDDEQNALLDLKSHFPNAIYNQQVDDIQSDILKFFNLEWNAPEQIKLHLKGTDFQLKVWEALLKIPVGGLKTYGNIAESINSPKASRAVGTAIGSNPVAFVIPCHRVIQASGIIGGYMWGPIRKTAIIGWEAAQTDLSNR